MFSPGAADCSCQRSPLCSRNKFASVCWQDRRQGNCILPVYLHLSLPLDVAAGAARSVVPLGIAKWVMPQSWLLFHGGLVHVALQSARSFKILTTKIRVYNPASKITANPRAFQAGFFGSVYACFRVFATSSASGAYGQAPLSELAASSSACPGQAVGIRQSCPCQPAPRLLSPGRCHPNRIITTLPALQQHPPCFYLHFLLICFFFPPGIEVFVCLALGRLSCLVFLNTCCDRQG